MNVYSAFTCPESCVHLVHLVHLSNGLFTGVILVLLGVLCTCVHSTLTKLYTVSATLLACCVQWGQSVHSTTLYREVIMY